MSQPTTVNKCGIKGYVPPPASQLARAGGNNCPNCASNYGYQICSLSPGRVFSTYQLDQRRKVEIMQYKNNSAHLSRAQQYSMASRNALTRKKSWATQTQTYTNPNVDNLPEVQIPINNVLSTVSLSCVRANNNITCNLTSDCDVPGPVIPLCVDYSVPLYNYRPQITYSSGRSYYIVPPTIKPTPVPSVLINTQNFAEPIGTSIYYLAQGPILYVMPAGSFMTSFSVNIDGTNNSIIFQNASGSNLFTWTDNQTRTVTVSTVVNLTTAVNISGCTQFTFGNPQGALASYTSTGTPLLGIIIYGYVQ